MQILSSKMDIIMSITMAKYFTLCGRGDTLPAHVPRPGQCPQSLRDRSSVSPKFRPKL